jgi:large subunit ribosomal protein L23Ae
VRAGGDGVTARRRGRSAPRFRQAGSRVFDAQRLAGPLSARSPKTLIRARDPKYPRVSAPKMQKLDQFQVRGRPAESTHICRKLSQQQQAVGI